MKKLLVLYKTHLDVGFTDLSEKVMELYLTRHIPHTVDTALAVNADGKKRYVWQTGSWLIDEYLKYAHGEDLARVEEAIHKGYISWHALPCTFHTELFSRELLEYGLSISQKLDQKYGITTIAAKATDVPGMTKAMISPLVKAGVRFLHIGVNKGSAVPEVPPLFRWVNDEGEELIVMYNGVYGEFSRISDDCAALLRFPSGDNGAPLNAQEILKRMAEHQAEYPDYEIIPASLNEVAAEALKVADTLPVVTEEIGDSWIHGVMSDPRKVAGYCAMLRYAKTREDAWTRNRIYSRLLLIPEHTWGLDEKKTLDFGDPYDKKGFTAMLQTPPYRRFEHSWEEQRNYLRAAADAVGDEDGRHIPAEYKRAPVCLEHGSDKLPKDFAVNETGEIVSLKLGGKVLATKDHPLCSFFYEQFCEEDYRRFHQQYNRPTLAFKDPWWWIREDFGKSGMGQGVDRYYSYVPELESCAAEGNRVVINCRMPEESCERFGAPRKLQTVLTFEENRVLIDFAWFNKDKNRMAEAMWLRFRPVVADPLGWRIEKIGQMIDPFHHVRRGGVQNYTLGVVQNENLKLDFIDGGLITFGKPNLLNFRDDIINGEELSVNLSNNIWGTNFRMWNGDDGRIRIEMSVD